MLNYAANDWIDNGKTWIAGAPKIRLLPRKPGRNADQSKGEADGYPLPRDVQMDFFRALPIHQYQVAWFILMTGCREHEVVPVRDKESRQLISGLKWSQEVKLPNGLFVFDLPNSKNNQPKRIFLNSVAREIVDSCRGDHPVYVFTWKGNHDKGIARPFQKVNNSAWKRARKAAGLENVRGKGMHFRVHDLRHTTGARLREEGVSREDRKDILGHANDDITTHYSTAETTYLIEKVERLVNSKRPSLYVVKNTHTTHSDSDESENAVSS
jgi:integrase